MPVVSPGDLVEPLALENLAGGSVPVPDPEGRLVHLQFRRFAGCPVCHLHLREFAARAAEIEAAGVVEVVLFYSSAEQMLPYQRELPFHVVVDPSKALYRRFGVEASVRSIGDPRAWSAMVRGVVASSPLEMLRGSMRPLGLPGDFLIGADGRVVAAKYAAHADDGWTVDALLDQARRASEAAPRA